MIEKKYSFAVDKVNAVKFDDYEDEDFAIVRLGFLSDRPNSHGLDIKEKVLKENAHTSLGKFIIGKIFFGDTMGHEANENIFGYVPKDQKVEFEEEDGAFTRAYVTAVISKIYAKDFYEILEEDVTKAVSVEMTVTTPGEDDSDVLAFNVHGITVLGRKINPSCPKSTITMVRFSEKKATEFYDKISHNYEYQLYQLAEKRRKSFMAEKTYKVDKSKDALSDRAWGDVDKTELRNKIMEATNKASLVKDVYMVVEDGWESAPSEKLKYPVMCFEGDTLVYNKGGLSSALGYAKAENDETVVSKVEAIRKKLDLEEDKKEDEKKMAEIEGRKAWGAVIRKVQDHEGKGVYVDSIEDNHIIYTKGDVRYRVEADIKVDPDDKSVDAKIDWNTVKKDKDQKMAEDDKKEKNKKMDDDPDDNDKDDHDDDDDDKKSQSHTEEMSFEDMKTAFAKLKEECESKDHIIMEKEKEIKELRKFKKGVEDKEKVEFVEKILSQIQNFVEKEQLEELRTEGLACEFEQRDAWANKAKAISFEADQKVNKPRNKDSFWGFSAPKDVDNKSNRSLWERL